MDNSGMSLRKLATILGVSQPFLSQIRAGKRPLPEGLKRQVQALGAYHLLIGDKQIDTFPGDEGAGMMSYQARKLERAMGFEPTTSCLGSKHSTPELRPLGEIDYSKCGVGVGKMLQRSLQGSLRLAFVHVAIASVRPSC